MPEHWLTRRDDPRTVLVVSILVLASGVLFAALGTGIPSAFMAIWIAVSLAQTVYAIVAVHRQQQAGRAEPGGGTEPNTKLLW
jgi:hypothetical protein